jgi:hypothetical protein
MRAGVHRSMKCVKTAAASTTKNESAGAIAIRIELSLERCGHHLLPSVVERSDGRLAGRPSQPTTASRS